MDTSPRLNYFDNALDIWSSYYSCSFSLGHVCLFIAFIDSQIQFLWDPVILTDARCSYFWHSSLAEFVLDSFLPNVPFWSPWKQKTKGLLMGVKREHWEENGSHVLISGSHIVKLFSQFQFFRAFKTCITRREYQRRKKAFAFNIWSTKRTRKEAFTFKICSTKRK